MQCNNVNIKRQFKMVMVVRLSYPVDILQANTKTLIHNIYSQQLHNNKRTLLVSMVVKHNNVLLNLITGCLYWLTTCFSQLHDHHQVYKT